MKDEWFDEFAAKLLKGLAGNDFDRALLALHISRGEFSAATASCLSIIHDPKQVVAEIQTLGFALGFQYGRLVGRQEASRDDGK